MFFENDNAHLQLKNQLVQLYKTNRVPHALLFSGKQGSGHFQLAMFFAKVLLCKEVNSGPCGQCSSCKKIANFNHPDLHFSFPIHLSKSEKSEISEDQRASFVNMVREYHCIGKQIWYAKMGNENKQGVIGVKEGQEIIKKLQLKSYEGGKKILIIWLPELMNVQAANKLLKLIEEPPEKTNLIFVSDHSEQLLQTITSRLQQIKVPPLENTFVSTYLQSYFNVEENDANMISKSAGGNLHKAIYKHLNNEKSQEFLAQFVQWMRLCYSRNISDTIDWVNNFSKKGRETNKEFLRYTLELFRQCITNHYMVSMDGLSTEEEQFLIKFKPFINHRNIIGLNEVINEAHYHVERNGNIKILMLDVSLQLYKLIRNSK